MNSLDNPLYQWIISFLTLRDLPLDDDILIPRSPNELGYPGPNASPEETAAWQARVNDYQAKRTIRDVYIKSGWDPNLDVEELEREEKLWEALEHARQKAKAGFRGEEFERRKEVWQQSL